jgi:hypothetical protein
MKHLSLVCGGLGVLVVVVTVVMRLSAGPTHMVFGMMPAAHALIVGNTMLLVALFLRGCCQCPCTKEAKPEKAP